MDFYSSSNLLGLDLGEVLHLKKMDSHAEKGLDLFGKIPLDLEMIF